MRDRAPLGFVAVEKRRVRASDDLGELPSEVRRVLDPCVHALTASGRMDVRGVAGDEDPSVAVVVCESDVRPPHRRPRRFDDPDVCAARGLSEHALEVLDAEVGCDARGEFRLVLVEIRRGKRAQGRGAVRGAPHVPGFPVESVDGDIGDEHAHVLTGLADEGDPGLLADGAVATVCTDEPARPDGLLDAVARDDGGDPACVLCERFEPGAEAHRPAEPAEEVPQRFLDAPLRGDHARRIRNVRPVEERARHATDRPGRAVGGDDGHRHRACVGEHLLDDAEVLEHLQGARLQSFSPRAGLGSVRGVDDLDRHAPAGELAGERESGGAGSDDEHGGGCDGHGDLPKKAMTI
nr:hypothetical protein [Brevibacterium casei]